MKTLLALLLTAVTLTAAETVTFHTMLLEELPPPFRKNDAAWQAHVRLAYLRPVIQFGNEVWDMGPSRYAAECGCTEFVVPKEPGTHIQLVVGRVLQVLNDGVLVEPDRKSMMGTASVFLFRPPGLTSMVDGEPFAALARPRPPYSYTSAAGARRTVAAYDCGELPEAELIAKAKAHTAERVAVREARLKKAVDDQRAAVKAELDRKVAEGKARAEKAKAEREKK